MQLSFRESKPNNGHVNGESHDTAGKVSRKRKRHDSAQGYATPHQRYGIDLLTGRRNRETRPPGYASWRDKSENVFDKICDTIKRMQPPVGSSETLEEQEIREKSQGNATMLLNAQLESTRSDARYYRQSQSERLGNGTVNGADHVTTAPKNHQQVEDEPEPELPEINNSMDYETEDDPEMVVHQRKRQKKTALNPFRAPQNGRSTSPAPSATMQRNRGYSSSSHSTTKSKRRLGIDYKRDADLADNLPGYGMIHMPLSHYVPTKQHAYGSMPASGRGTERMTTEQEVPNYAAVLMSKEPKEPREPKEHKEPTKRKYTKHVKLAPAPAPPRVSEPMAHDRQRQYAPVGQPREIVRSHRSPALAESWEREARLQHRNDSSDHAEDDEEPVPSRGRRSSNMVPAEEDEEPVPKRTRRPGNRRN